MIPFNHYFFLKLTPLNVFVTLFYKQPLLVGDETKHMGLCVRIPNFFKLFFDLL